MTAPPSHSRFVRYAVGLAVFIVLVAIAGMLFWQQRDAVQQLLTGWNHPADNAVRVPQNRLHPAAQKAPADLTSGNSVPASGAGIPPLHDGPIVLRSHADARVVMPSDGYEEADREFAMLRTFAGHKASSVIVSLPGSWQILSAGADGVVELWNTKTGMRTAEFTDDGSTVHGLAVGPNGHHFATACDDGKIRIWNLAEQSVVRELKGHTGPALSVDYSPDGKQLVTGGEDRAIRLWNVSDGKQQRVAFIHDDPITCVAYRPQGDSVLAGSSRGEVVQWRPTDGHALRFFHSEASQPVRTVQFIPGTQAVMIGVDNANGATTNFRDLKTGLQYPDITHGYGHIQQAIFDKKRKLIYAVRGAELIRVDSIENLRRVRELTGDSCGKLTGIVWLPERHFATLNEDGQIAVWGKPPAETAIVSQRWDGHHGEISAIAIARSGEYAASTGQDKTIRIWDTNSGKTQTSWQVDDQVKFLALSSNGSRLATVGFDGSIRLWNVETKRLVAQMPAGNSRKMNPRFSIDDEYLIVSNQQGNIVVLDSKDASLIKQMFGHDKFIWTIQILDNGRLVSFGNDNTIRIWDIAAGREVRRYDLELGRIGCGLVLQDESRLIVSIASEGKAWISLWDLATNIEVSRLQTEGRSAYRKFALSDDERYLFGIGKNRCSYRVWDLERMENSHCIYTPDACPRELGWISTQDGLLTAGGKTVNRWRTSMFNRSRIEDEPAPPALPE